QGEAPLLALQLWPALHLPRGRQLQEPRRALLRPPLRRRAPQGGAGARHDDEPLQDLATAGAPPDGGGEAQEAPDLYGRQARREDPEVTTMKLGAPSTVSR